MKHTKISAIFLATALMASVTPSKAQSIGDCRISAIYKYCLMVKVFAMSKADDSLKQKIESFYEATYSAHKGKVGREDVDAQFVARAVKDLNKDANGTLLLCVGANNDGLVALSKIADKACR